MFQIGDSKPDTIVVTDIDTPADQPSTVYDLIANVTHESVAGTTRDKANTVWKVHLRAAGGAGENEKWFLIQDLIVEETRKEMIFLGETILQVRRFGNSYYGRSVCNALRFGKGVLLTLHQTEPKAWMSMLNDSRFRERRTENMHVSLHN